MPPIQVTAREIQPGQYRVDKEQDGPRRQHNAAAANSRNSSNTNNGRDLNHLLGFTLPPRQHPPPRTSRRSARNAPSWHNTRERYINAQYRFMLKPTGDYTVHFADPDIYFHWPDVLQVIVPTSSVLSAAAHTFEGPSSSHTDSLLPSCPICLSEPVAPRMTKCGHIFCYPCLLHYLELADTGQKCRSCPICFDTVYGRDLKSVKWFDPVSAASQTDAKLDPSNQATTPEGNAASTQEGDFITLRLIHRTTISTLALPKSKTWPSEIIPPHAAPWYFAPDIMSFSRFMLATPDYMASELKQDLQQLTGEVETLRKLGTAADDLGMVFIEAARRKVGEQLEKVAVLRTDLVQRSSETTWLELEALDQRRDADIKRRQLAEERALASSTSAEETDEYVPPDHVLIGNQSAYLAPPSTRPSAPRTTPSHPSPHATNRHQRQRRNVNPPAPNDATYLFYQASSGQHIYLHPLDIKILKSHYETYAAFPDSIRVRVEGTEEGSMNEDLRKKCRYLSHLPEACDLTFVEADMSSFIPPSALVPYAQALRKRGAKRRDRAKKDDKARIKSEQAAAEKERQNYYRTNQGSAFARLAISEPVQENEFSFPVLQETPSRELRPTTTDDTAALSTSPSSLPKSGTSEAGKKTVWGTRAVTPPPGAQRSRHEDEDLDYTVDSVWNDFDNLQQRGGRRQGRKKKVVLNLSGGTLAMRR